MFFPTARNPALRAQGSRPHHACVQILHQFVSEPHACPYLPDRDCRTEYSYIPFLKPGEYEELMEGGYRKFGALVFRPVCSGCTECRSLRIPVAKFQPDRSQRRAWKRNSHRTVRVAPPVVDDVRLELYHRYHAAQTARKGWPETERDPDEYAFSFVESPIPGLEISVWEADRLQAVVLTDVTPNAVSGIYHYYDPELSAEGIGTFCMLQTLELARRLEKEWAYFGYYVSGCPSLAYKARFRPHQIRSETGAWGPPVSGSPR